MCAHFLPLLFVSGLLPRFAHSEPLLEVLFLWEHPPA